MSLRRTFQIIAPRDSAGAMIRAIAAHLADADRDRLLAALAAGVEGLVRAIHRDDHEMPVGSSLCLGFLFPPDNGLRDYLEIDPGEAMVERVALGCIWCDLFVGDRFVQFMATAATGDMSHLFYDSAPVRAVFVDMARQTPGATLGLTNDIDDDWTGLWSAPGAQAYAEANPTATTQTDRECLNLLNIQSQPQFFQPDHKEPT